MWHPRRVHVEIESLRLDFHVNAKWQLSHIKTQKPSLKGSIYRPKIEPLRLKMLLTDILSELAY